MTEGFRSPPPAGPGFTGTAAPRQDAVDTVQRIMGEDAAPPERPRTRSVSVYAGIPADSANASRADVAKQQANDVTDTAKQAGVHVAETVKEQASQVTTEAKYQAKQLLAQAQSELTEQAAGTQQRVSEGLHALADELSGMARNSEQDGVATDLARQAADKARMAAGWLADRDPGSLLDEVRSFARKKPGTYLALALGAGVLAGRLTRGLGAPAENSDQPERTSATTGSSQVGSEHHALGAGLPTVDPYGYDPIPDPVLPATPAGSGNGGSGTFGGPRGVVAP